MKGKEIAAAVSDILPVTWVDKRLPGMPGEGWFLLNANPLPPSGEVVEVISDICADRDLLVEGGRVKHYPRCSGVHHVLKPDLTKVVERLRPQTFKVAVHPGIPGQYSGQPLAIPIDPVISFADYPDHPHLNIGGRVPRGGFEGYLPDSLCYLEDIAGLASDPVKRFRDTFLTITVWLFRHMVWQESRMSCKRATWIGPEGHGPPAEEYALVRDPLGPCRCGGSKSYFDCHLGVDIQKKAGLSPADKHLYMRDSATARLIWEVSYKAPQQHFVTSLKDLLASQGT